MTQTETTGYTLHPNHSFLVKRVTDGGEGTTKRVTRPFIGMHASTENQLTRRDDVVMVFIIIVVLSVMR